GPVARGLASWIPRAASSFPVPDSPVSNTGASCAATRARIPNRRRISGVRPTISPNPSRAGPASSTVAESTTIACSPTLLSSPRGESLFAEVDQLLVHGREDRVRRGGEAHRRVFLEGEPGVVDADRHLVAVGELVRADRRAVDAGAVLRPIGEPPTVHPAL